MLINPNKGKTGIHGCHCMGDIAVRIHEVVARPWVGVCAPFFKSCLKKLTAFDMGTTSKQFAKCSSFYLASLNPIPDQLILRC